MGSSLSNTMWQLHVKTDEEPNNRGTVSGLVEIARSSVLKDN